MNSELTSCPNIYTAFTEGKDISELTTAFNDYALHNKYDTYFGDVVPLLCANALGINIITLSDSYKDCLSKIIFSKSKIKGCLFIYKHGDHYDGFIPMEHIYDDPGEPLWQSGLTHNISAINNEILASDKSNDSIMLSSTNLQIYETFDSQNLISDPTCFKKQNGSLIDLCLVSNPLRFN